MTKLYWLLLGIALLVNPARSQQPQSTPRDSVARINSPLQQILDSLRQRPNLKGLKIKLQDINFETNSFRLTASSAVYLDTIAAVLNKIPAVILEIGGHTDNIGLPRNNQVLSENRARAVRDRLIGPGQVVAKRITFRGYGEERPVAPNTTESGRLLNRRVEMQFIGLNTEVVNKIYLRSGQTILVPLVYLSDRTILYKTGENDPLQEIPCGSVLRVEFADGRVQLIDCPPEQTPTTIIQQPPTVRKASQLYTQLRGAAGYMVGDRPNWTSKTDGYAHVVGFGGEGLVGYRLSNWFTVALQTGYWRWSTQVDYKESAEGPVQSQYFSEATQIPLFLSIPVYLTHSVHLTPEAGINLLMIKAGFDSSRESFSGLQIGYGGAIGYTTNRSKRVWTDLSLFYRAHQKATWTGQYGVPPMNYAGLRIGVGFLF
ncbi:OmpA family protein [Spirosoma taeanense]|uniref:OmpA family protein n=1 Tax=Spirosoma taeanense TaxID=2735870 RepID=A0A6M5YDB5_9BACT|nr:OmpA family protein [Spirosoma taeanense]QJW91261.1 OmpA family protein [Spirosoma taeanense]